MGVLSNVTTRIQKSEFLRPVDVEQRKAGRETKGYDLLPTTAQYVFLAASALDVLNVPLTLPQLIHCFLNTRNATLIQ